jgi:hypothetical protein
VKIVATAIRILFLCWCLPAFAQQIELERRATTNGAILISNPKNGAATNPFQVTISNQTASWYVLRTDPLSSVTNAGTPIVMVLGPYQSKQFPAALSPGQFVGWHAVSALALDEIPSGKNADLATAALGLFTIDVMARLIFNVELPHTYAFNGENALTGLRAVFNVSGNDALELTSEIAAEYGDGQPDTAVIMAAVTRFVLLTKEDWINGQLGLLIQQLFNADIASQGLGLLGGIAGPLDVASYAPRLASVRILMDSTLDSPRDDYVQISAKLPVPLPTKPARLSASSSGGAVTLSWDAVAGADGYRVKYGNSSGVETVLDAGNKTTLTIAQLPVGVYLVWIEAYNRQGGSGYADFIVVTVSPKPPLSVPAGYVVQGGLLWSPRKDAPAFWSDASDYCTRATFAGRTGWRLPTQNELTSMAASGRLNAGAEVWSGTPVPAQSGSYYAVRLASSGNGRVSTRGRLDASYVTCVNAGDVPAPTNLRVTAGDGRVTLTWNAVPGAASYTLYRATDRTVTPRNYTTLPGGAKVSNVTSPYVQTGLANNTPYYFTVTAVNSAGESIEADTVQATPVFASLPDGFIVTVGLLWMPVSLELDWASANAYCTGTVMNGQGGWRLPTLTEASTFRNAFTARGGFGHPKWKTLDVWTSTPSAVISTWYYFTNLDVGVGLSSPDSNKLGVTCVR